MIWSQAMATMAASARASVGIYATVRTRLRSNLARKSANCTLSTGDPPGLSIQTQTKLAPSRVSSSINRSSWLTFSR